jgi:hypothetical protein
VESGYLRPDEKAVMVSLAHPESEVVLALRQGRRARREPVEAATRDRCGLLGVVSCVIED